MARKVVTDMLQQEGLRAPEVRIARGEVKQEQVPQFGPGGRVVGLTKADRVQNQVVRCFRRGDITYRQFLAGERLSRIVELIGSDVRSCLNFDTGGGDLHIAMLAKGGASMDAALKVWSALSYVGPTLAPIVCWVVVHGRAASDWSREVKKPLRDGMAALRLGLDALADHYRM